MTNRNNDDIANALHGLASGEHVDPDPHEGSGTGQAHHLDAAAAPPPAGTPSPATPPAAPAPPPRPPGIPFRASPRPQPPGAAGTPPAAGMPPAPARPGIPPMRPRPQPQPHPTSSTRAPTPTSPPPPARPRSPVQPGTKAREVLPPGVRPASSGAVPNLTPPTSAAAGVDAGAGGAGAGAASSAAADWETTDVQPVDEDDRVIVPAAPLSSLGPRTHHRPGAPRVPMFKTLKFRRTAIPILLTAGAILLAVPALRFVVHPDSVMATLPLTTCAMLAGAAVLLLGVAAMNMAQVRHQLAAEKADTPGAVSSSGATSSSG